MIVTVRTLFNACPKIRQVFFFTIKREEKTNLNEFIKTIYSFITDQRNQGQQQPPCSA